MSAGRGVRRLRPVPSIAAATPYVAGTRAASGPGSLAQNEIAEPSPAAIAAIVAAASSINRYPDPLATALRTRLAALHGVDPDCILVGNGSDELLFLLATAFGGPGRSVCCADPPYWGHAQPATITGTAVTRVPLIEHRHDLPAMAHERVDIAFVCNPHNPTATAVSRNDLRVFRAEARAHLVVVDEAYINFVDDPDAVTAIPLVADGDLCVLRTFSKYHGLAGLRIGYLVGSTDLVATLRAVRAPFSVNVLAQAAAAAVLEDPEHTRRTLLAVRRNRGLLRQLFASAGFRTVPSQANFVLVLCGDQEPQLIATLAAAGVSVRAGHSLGLPGSVRVTVPDDDGLRLLADAMHNRASGVDGVPGASA